jgi:hypothetical protein
VYNLMVTAMGGGWDGTPYEYHLARAIHEHTSDDLTAKYGSFNDASIKELMSFPCLFAYETGNKEPALIGWLTRIRRRDNLVRIEYQLEPSLPLIPSDELPKLGWDLDIGSMELYRTHWALKDADLLPVLMEAGLISSDAINSQPPGSKVITLGLYKSVTDLIAQPSVFRLPASLPQNDLVSVMMPFSAGFINIYKAIEAACNTAKLKCEKADDIWDSSEIIQDIFSLIYRSKVVVCDFTGRNPNVFYETGIAHTLGRSVIPIAQHESDVPFDLRHHRFILYLNNEEGLTKLTEKILGRLRTLVRI